MTNIILPRYDEWQISSTSLQPTSTSLLPWFRLEYRARRDLTELYHEVKLWCQDSIPGWGSEDNTGDLCMCRDLPTQYWDEASLAFFVPRHDSTLYTISLDLFHDEDVVAFKLRFC